MVAFEVPEVDYTRYSNRQLAAVPLAVLAVALAILVGWSLFVAGSPTQPGAPASLGIEFTGGTELLLTTDAPESEIRSAFTQEAESLRQIQSATDGQTAGSSYIVTFQSTDADVIEDQARAAGFAVESSQGTSASFGKETQQLALYGLVIAFAGMSLLVFVLFRTFVPSIAVVLSAFSDIVIPIALMNLLGIKLSLGTVAALLMLIGYSVDSDILLNNHILRRSGGFYESAYRAMRTGVTMTVTSLSAMAVMTLVAYFFGIELLSDIGLVLVFGLAADLMNTYMLNMSLLRWYKYEGVAPMSLRDNWRIILLVIFLLVSVFALFVPGGVVSGGEGGTNGNATAGTASQGLSNLKFGLELSGGTRIRAPLIGITATDVNVTVDEKPAVERTVANQLDGVTVADVTARPSTQTVEVFVENVSEEQFANALQAAGYSVSPDQIRSGVTEQTREDTVDVIRSKVSEAGFSGGNVKVVQPSAEEYFVVIEMPNANRTQVENLVDERGVVEIVAQFPAENGPGYRNETVLVREDMPTIGTATQGQSGPYVPITLAQDSGQEYQNRMVEYGFTDEGVQSCHGVPEGERYCLHTVVDGEIVYSADMGSNLATSMRDETFQESPTFIMLTTNMSEARELMVHLRAGALPAPLAIDGEQGTSYFLSPSLASDFKLYSLITGLIAALAVAGAVFVRYRDPRVAAPMFVTAISEVVILLGFASAVGLPLDLSHIAGFIAVIGTGVDDLVIIADEVMAEGSVNSDRVFRSRFRKAFWVIGAAAATTIIAMSPLAVLSLGDLRGLAIITILGVLIGVLVTRPAYGDVLRSLLTDK